MCAVTIPLLVRGQQSQCLFYVLCSLTCDTVINIPLPHYADHPYEHSTS